MEAHEYTQPGAAARPREQLLARGAEHLSDRDLLAVILGHGTARIPIQSLASRVLAALDAPLPAVATGVTTLGALPGVGPARQAQILAALELGRRRYAPRGTRIRTAADVVPLLRHVADRPQEHFLVVTLNGAHEVAGMHVISVGLVNRTLVHPREVFAPAIVDRATAIICAHNHPSGNVDPSPDDRTVTQTLAEAGALLGVRLLDHIIFAPERFYSFRDHGEV